ncbi:AP-4 complex accessory subunit tepsin-like isoform X1 [Rhopilema esculentum]|uniref:AP-4 complex accessory subunit tepsin-like isoform X1 n=1 Tax=Rhopilema esculentum TaxID=499914 RepID=UPI0031DFEA26
MSISGLMSKVTFVNKVPLLMKATSADASLPAGHIYDEIANITYESLAHNDVLVEFLTERLKKASPHVKLKVLLIMKAVVRKGHKEFQQSLSKQSQGIREAKNFSGPPDPLHGDAPYVKVREAAGELLELLFDTDGNQNDARSQQINQPTRKMEGFGSSNYGGARQMPSSFITSSRSQENQDRGALGNAIQHVKDTFSYAFNENAKAINNYHQRDSDLSGSYQRLEDNERKFIKRPSQTLNLLGSNADTPKRVNLNSSNVPAVELREEAKWMSSMANTESAYNDGYSSQNWSQESVLIEKVTTPGGVRLAPGKTELQDFIKKCESLNFEKIVELIDEKLQSSDYRVQMKSLFLIESLLNCSISNARETIAELLSSSLEALCQSSQTVVKNKSRKLVQILKSQESIFSNQEDIQTEDGKLQQSEEFLLDLPAGTTTSPDSATEQSAVHGADAVITNGDDLLSLIGDLNIQEKAQVSSLMTQDSHPSDVFGIISQEVIGTTSVAVSEPSSHGFLDFDQFARQASVLNKASDVSSSSQSMTSKSTSFANSEANFNLDIIDINLDPFATPVERNTTIGRPHLEPEIDLDPFSAAANNLGQVNADSHKSNFDFLSQNDSTDLFSTTESDKIASRTFSPSQNSIMTQQSSNWGFQGSSSEYQQLNISPSMIPLQGHSLQGSNVIFNTAVIRPTTRTQSPIVQRPGISPGVNPMSKGMIRPNAPNANGFDFIGGGKKAGAFDFVKEAMEASKRK